MYFFLRHVSFLCFSAVSLCNCCFFFFFQAMVGVLMTMLDKGVRLHPDSYSVVISKANQVRSSFFRPRGLLLSARSTICGQWHIFGNAVRLEET